MYLKPFLSKFRMLQFLIFCQAVFLAGELYAVDTRLDVRQFRLGSSGARSSDSTLFFSIFGVVVGILILAFIYKKFISQNMFKGKSKAKDAILKSQLKQMSISQGNATSLVKIAQVAERHPSDLLSSNEEFEAAVDIVNFSPEKNALSTKITALREALGYTFNNQRTKFIKSQMLLNGQKVRASIPHPTKNLSYVATVLNVTEDNLWINPPMIKGKAANLSKIRYLEINVFRSNDAEYRFRCKVLNQISSPMKAVILEHSSQIERMMKREHDRFEIEISNHFTIISQKSSDGFRGQVGNEIKGVILDLSAGGLRFETTETDTAVEVGDMAVFRLDEARINKSIQAKIVRINPKGNTTDIHLMFLNLTELNRLFITRFLENRQAKKI